MCIRDRCGKHHNASDRYCDKCRLCTYCKTHHCDKCEKCVLNDFEHCDNCKKRGTAVPLNPLAVDDTIAHSLYIRTVLYIQKKGDSCPPKPQCHQFQINLKFWKLSK